MKMVVATAALATLLTSPALAQNGVRPYRAYAYPYAAFAQDYYKGGFRRSLNRSLSVYNTRGRYVGSDPDPRIRFMLAHDPPNDAN
jgi:hypothetical protein